MRMNPNILPLSILHKPGIYVISSVCDKLYVGSSNLVRWRLRAHLSALRNQKHDNSRLQNYFNKYGEESLSFDFLEYCDQDKLIEREQFWIDKLNPFFNIAKTAGATYGLKPWLGRKHTEETKKKIKETNLKTFAKRPKKEKPIRLTREENIQRLAAINKTPEGRKRCSDLHKGNQYWLGKKHNPETIANRIGGLNPNSKPIYCPELNITFGTQKEAYTYFSVKNGDIFNAVNKNKLINGTYSLVYASR